MHFIKSPFEYLDIKKAINGYTSVYGLIKKSTFKYLSAYSLRKGEEGAKMPRHTGTAFLSALIDLKPVYP
ncbi:hypothetical protein DCCM_3894 [Desulfocucumis palustris]|uniref:Uncharacterized protein n=1 Tax=Desulfocucumis palustris TaxID=1898651 RepID=A0A2L2XFI0_9FIRM|nr:hypothetical protein DCCM_3894 [Desulfocucumis palustris]